MCDYDSALRVRLFTLYLRLNINEIVNHRDANDTRPQGLALHVKSTLKVRSVKSDPGCLGQKLTNNIVQVVEVCGGYPS